MGIDDRLWEEDPFLFFFSSLFVFGEKNKKNKRI